MPLIECPECGSRISDTATSCPQCGFAQPGGTGTLVFTRPGFMNSAVGLEIYVDGKPYGRVRGLGGRLAVPVTPGSHHVELITSQGKSSIGTVQTGRGQTEIQVKISAFGSPQMS